MDSRNVSNAIAKIINIDTAQRRAEEYTRLILKALDCVQGAPEMDAVIRIVHMIRREALEEVVKVCDEHKISLSGNEPNYCRHHNCGSEIADAIDRLREGR